MLTIEPNRNYMKDIFELQNIPCDHITEVYEYLLNSGNDICGWLSLSYITYVNLIETECQVLGSMW